MPRNSPTLSPTQIRLEQWPSVNKWKLRQPASPSSGQRKRVGWGKWLGENGWKAASA